MVFSTSSAPATQPSRGDSHRLCIPDHELLFRIGGGAYGEVWLARNIVGVLRAVKIVRRDQHESTESFEREFKGLQRFEPISRTHDGLVDILTLGLLADRAGFYYVMELADQAGPGPNGVAAERTRLMNSEGGAPTPESKSKSEPPHVGCYEPRTLRGEFKSRGAMPAEEVVILGLKLAAALSHLHANGLVHRDVKPSNILFVGGEPKLADAGLVADMDDARSLVGTAGYIAPEGPGTPQADLYALGKVLYEAAFGKDRKEFPCLPADVASRSDHARLLELNEVIGKACATDSRERYANASSMLAELTALQSGSSIRRQRARRQIWIHAIRFAFGCAAVAILIAVVQGLSNRLAQAPDTPQSAPEFVWSTNEMANEDFLTGVRLLQAEGDNPRAIQQFKSAIEKDPNFAEAYARLAWAHYSYGDSDPNPKEGPAAAEKAVQLNPKLAYAHSMLATARFHELKWAEAEKERKLAINLNPNSQEILLESALNLAIMGRTTEALRDLEKARRANPDSASNMREEFYVLVLAWCRQYDVALEGYERLGSGSYFANQQRALAYLGRGDFPNFMRFSRRALLARNSNPDEVNAQFEALEKAYQEGGEENYWRLNLQFESVRQDPDHLMRMAAGHARVRQPGEAFRFLKKAMQETPGWFSTGLYINPSFDRLRNEREFAEFQGILDELWGKK